MVIGVGAAVNRHDMKLVQRTLEGIMIKPPERDIIKEFGFTAHIRACGEEAQAIKKEACFKARRWVVEHTRSWMNRFCRILARWEKFPETILAMLYLTCAAITWRATCLLK